MTAATRHRIDTLIATDIAARGIDVDCISHVVNFDLPHVPEDYVHRIGRTARAGQQGDAISLVAPEERSQLAAIERLVGKPIRCEHVAGFTPAASAVENHPAQPPKSAAGRPAVPAVPAATAETRRPTAPLPAKGDRRHAGRRRPTHRRHARGCSKVCGGQS